MGVDSAAVPPGASGGAADLQTQFLASLNHEVRTPLTGILGMTDLLLETSLNEEQKEYVAAARLCAEDLLGLFNKTLEYSELSAGCVTPARREFHLPEAVRGAVSAYAAAARSKGLRLTCHLEPMTPEVAVGDAGRLQRLIGHLVENAVKFTERGRVEVNASSEEAGGKLTLHLNVHDTGIGIPADKLSLVFDSFRQLDSGLARRYDGLGLGLSLVKGLTALLGGSVAVASDARKGTTFSLAVPFELPEKAEYPPGLESPAPAYSDKRRRILLVEDNALAGSVLTHVLKRAGYRVRCATDGREAVRWASLHHYDLILMDLQLPGMDGFDTTRRIRDLPGHASTAVIALTANAGERYRRECFTNGMQGFLAKPVKAKDLLDMVAGVLR